MSFPLGSRIRTVMGVRLSGKVVRPFSLDKANDGTYRNPSSQEKDAVYIEWDNGTRGWMHSCHLQEAK